MNVVIDCHKLFPLIKSFYELSGIKISIYDNDFKEVLTYPEESSAFCQTVWGCCGKEKCDRFTAEVWRKHTDEKDTLVYTCHAGLTEVMSPLREKDTIFGYAVCGQVTNIADRDSFANGVLERCKSFGMDEAHTKELLKEIKYWPDSHIEATLQIINALCSYIILQKMIYISEKPVGLQIADYIKENPGEDLSVEAIAKKFAMSKSNLYTVTKKYMPEGIAKYVRKSRIDAVIDEIKRSKETSDKPIWKIAREKGFENYEYFLRVFKQETGKSVKEIKKT